MTRTYAGDGTGYRAPRCICIDHTRCRRPAGKRGGDLYVCSRHATMWTLLLIDDGCSPSTRRLLAFARWETAREGQALIDRARRREAA